MEYNYDKTKEPEDTYISCPNCDHNNMLTDGDIRWCSECGYGEPN